MLLSTLALISLLTQAKPAPPTAQGDLSGGLNAGMWVRNQGTTTTYKGGWHGGASYRITSLISVMAEVSGDYRSASGKTAYMYLYSGGVRFQSDRTARVTPFGQLLFGGGQDNGNADTDKVNHYPMLRPGGGVDIGVSS